MRILVVDDDRDVRLICDVVLGGSGHEVIEARDGEEAVRLALQTRPDAIVLDIMMPKKDGLTALRELREAPDTASTPVVIISALASPADRKRGFDAGADEYLVKPFSPERLSQVIERLNDKVAEGLVELAGTD